MLLPWTFETGALNNKHAWFPNHAQTLPRKRARETERDREREGERERVCVWVCLSERASERAREEGRRASQPSPHSALAPLPLESKTRERDSERV